MSTLKVGDVEMKVVRTNHVGRRSFRTDDNAEHIYTDWTIDAECWWNPAATSYTGDVSSVFAAPFGGGGVLPAVTDASIREYLIQSRRQIDYRDDTGNIILLCRSRMYPSNDINCIYDVNNGPYVEYCDVNRIHGEKSWNISIRIRACVNECPGEQDQGGIPNPLISNRWLQYMDMDEDYFSTIVTEGVATFRGDELIRLGTYPDQYRKDLLFPIPNNYKRDPVYVEAASDGNTLRYRIVDREKPLNINERDFVPLGVTRIEAYHTGGYTHPGSLETFGQMIGSGIDGAAGNGVGGGLIGIGPGKVIGFVVGAGGALLRSVPQWHNGIVISIWGNRDSTRMGLTWLAIAIATARLGASTPYLGLIVRNTRWILTHDIMGKYVRLEIQFRWGIEQVINSAISGVTNTAIDYITNFINGAQALGQGVIEAIFGVQQNQQPANQAAQAVQNLNATYGPGAVFNALNFPPRWDNTADFIGSGDVGHTENVPILGEVASNDSLLELRRHPPPPNSSGTRGTSLLTIVSQLLNDPCGVPDRPPNLVQYRDLPIYQE